VCFSLLRAFFKMVQDGSSQSHSQSHSLHWFSDVEVVPTSGRDGSCILEVVRFGSMIFKLLKRLAKASSSWFMPGSRLVQVSS
jgi:hypothetical protein